jgi:hypothetical protein
VSHPNEAAGDVAAPTVPENQHGHSKHSAISRSMLVQGLDSWQFPKSRSTPKRLVPGFV